MKKLACLAGVVLAYFIIFFFGQINFAHPGETIYVRLQISITDRSKFISTEQRGMNTNQSTRSKFELFHKTSANTISLYGK